jgi:hypothetical protein
MKALILVAAMMLGLNVQATPVKQVNAKQSANFVTPDFDFTVTSPRAGLVTFTNFVAINGWPFVRGNLVSTIRWFYSTEGFDDITPETQYVEQWLNRDNSIPVLGIGNLTPGVRYYFKVGLATRTGEMIYFTNDYETDTTRHSVVVQ